MLHIPSVAYINYLNINEHDYEDIQPLITKTVPSTRRASTTGHMAIRYATIQYNKCSSAQSTKYGRLCITMSVNEWDNN